MCGIVGQLNLSDGPPPSEDMFRHMLAMIRHRGPDQFGIYLDDMAGLGNARLSIVDLESGQQPMSAREGRFWIVFNGEIFNHQELRKDLEAKGHRLSTHCDTEVFVHLYSEYGPDCLHRLNGQFGVAIWDAWEKQLFLARDRLGIRPLFYHLGPNVFLFGSEIKAFAVHPELSLELDPAGLMQVFTGWSCLPPKTPFCEVHQLPPGHYALIGQDKRLRIHSWWAPDFESRAGTDHSSHPTENEWLEELRDLLREATRTRLQADVPVGAYLSGGLDSSLIAALAREYAGERLDTFSIAFTDESFDERTHQEHMAVHLGTNHQVVEADYRDIGEVFPDVVWHAETPMLRTAPAPMYLLSRLVHRNRYKVVLTGEGADEFLAGYDLFKEARIRAFWARQPESERRPALLQRIYPDLKNLARLGPKYLSNFFGEGLTEVSASDYSHRIRWRNTRRIHRFFSPEMVESPTSQPRPWIDELNLPEGFQNWDLLDRAQYLEIVTFLSPYLLSSQGDRMAMAHSVEGRYPFLDYRVAEFCMRLPAPLRLRGLQDKRLLRKLGAQYLPGDICRRAKKPYRAPVHRSFFHEQSPDYVKDLLSEPAIQRAGVFQPAAVAALTRKIEGGRAIGEVDDMAIAGILSTQLLHSSFIESFPAVPPLSDRDDVKLCDHRFAVARN